MTEAATSAPLVDRSSSSSSSSSSSDKELPPKPNDTSDKEDKDDKEGKGKGKGKGMGKEKARGKPGRSALIKKRSSSLSSIVGASSSVSRAPEWIKSLRPLTQEQTNVANSNGALASKCSICRVKLGSQMGGDRKICKTCGRVTCRLCAVSVHLVGMVRRRYVCFYCIQSASSSLPALPGTGEAGNSSGIGSGNVSGNSSTVSNGSVPASEKQEGQLYGSDDEDEGEGDDEVEGPAALLSSLMDRVWDMWAQWMDTAPDESDELTATDQEQILSADSNAVSAVEDGEAPTYRRSRRLSQALSDGSSEGGVFDGDKMEQVFKAAHNNPDSKLVNAELFVQGCREIMALMSKLGKGFGFASTDMNHKLEMMHIRMKETAEEIGKEVESVTLQDMVERDIRNKTTHAGKKASPASRIILRLMWFLDYVATLLKKLGENPDHDLKLIVSSTYEETLGPRHAWMLRKIVRAGLGMVPDKKHFIPKLGFDRLSQEEQAAKLKKWSSTLEEVAADMWEYMKSKKLEVLP